MLRILYFSDFLDRQFFQFCENRVLLFSLELCKLDFFSFFSSRHCPRSDELFHKPWRGPEIGTRKLDPKCNDDHLQDWHLQKENLQSQKKCICLSVQTLIFGLQFRSLDFFKHLCAICALSLLFCIDQITTHFTIAK